MFETIAVIVAGTAGGVITAIFTSGRYKEKVDAHEDRIVTVEGKVERVGNDLTEHRIESAGIDEKLINIQSGLDRVERQNVGLMKRMNQTRISRGRS